MPELMEPTRVDRPEPVAHWDLPGTAGLAVDRTGEMVAIIGPGGVLLRVFAHEAKMIGPVLVAAAEWTDSDVVDATIVDDRPRIEYRWIVEGLSQTRPPWITDAAARTLGEDLAGWLAHCTPVVIVRDGEVWAS